MNFLTLFTGQKYTNTFFFIINSSLLSISTLNNKLHWFASTIFNYHKKSTKYKMEDLPVALY